MLDFKTILHGPCSVSRPLAGVVLSLTMLFSGCSSNPYPPVPEPQRKIAPDYNYVVGAGDNVEIFVWGNEELTTGVVVRPDGKITTRLVEDVRASGMTSTELAREIEKVYAEYVRQPVVSVIVNGFVGTPEQRVRVIGEATSPIGIPYTMYMSLLDLMIAVGGMTEYADGNNSVLVRMEDGKQNSYALRLDDLVKDGDISANITLMPGDVIIISESWF